MTEYCYKMYDVNRVWPSHQIVRGGGGGDMHGDRGGSGSCINKLPVAQAYYRSFPCYAVAAAFVCPAVESAGASLLDLDIDLVVRLCSDVRRMLIPRTMYMYHDVRLWCSF